MNIFCYLCIMAQTKEGAKKIAAKKIGISIESYNDLIKRGVKWCYKCENWIFKSDFCKDLSRYDNLYPVCKECRRNKHISTYVKKGKKSTKGNRYAEIRDNDKKQARSRVNHLIENRTIVNPNRINCDSCGHLGDDLRHEYHHHKGYNIENHENVISLCSKCHHLIHEK